jgi:hypothetical protein
MFLYFTNADVFQDLYSATPLSLSLSLSQSIIAIELQDQQQAAQQMPLKLSVQEDL